jgi:light-regulated signal transduction histidine kinase (bacteriophytochrome)
LQQFAYIASHDLQEPLRKIQAFGDRLQARYAEVLDERGRDYVRRMQAAAHRGRRLVTDLLVYSRVATRGQPFAAVDLSQVAREVVADLKERIEREGAQVDIGQLPTIDADAGQMRQLLRNLTDNALKFCQEGTAPVIRITCEPAGTPEGKQCQILVEDNGIGFDEKYLDRIFQPFQQLHGPGTYEGTGIGLAICRRIAERHGGSITARSTLGEGTTFAVTLPINQPKGEDTQ